MKVNFCNYANKKFEEQQNFLNDYAENSKQFDKILYFNPNCLPDSLLLKCKDILDCERGGGYWLWKPVIILTSLYQINEGDGLLYLDSGDIFYNNIRNLIQNVLSKNEILLTIGHNQQKKYCKRDCFVLMDCDEEKYWNNMQIEAGMIIIKNTENMRKLVYEWIKFATNPNIITDISNICGKDNFPEFIDHRHDQAILNNLKVKYNLPESDIIRAYTQGNYDPNIHKHIKL